MIVEIPDKSSRRHQNREKYLQGGMGISTAANVVVSLYILDPFDIVKFNANLTEVFALRFLFIFLMEILVYLIGNTYIRHKRGIMRLKRMNRP